MRRRIALLSLMLAAPVLVLLIAPPASGGDRLLCQPVWDVGEPFGGAGLNFVFGYNAGGSEPHDLTPSSPGDTLLATGVDPAMGLPPDAYDPALLNVPFRDVAVIVNFATDRAQVPSVYEAGPRWGAERDGRGPGGQGFHAPDAQLLPERGAQPADREHRVAHRRRHLRCGARARDGRLPRWNRHPRPDQLPDQRGRRVPSRTGPTPGGDPRPWSPGGAGEY